MASQSTTPHRHDGTDRERRNGAPAASAAATPLPQRPPPQTPLPQRPPAFKVAFTPAPARVGQTRRITAAFLELWKVGGQLAENIVLAVSELVTNAVEHGKGDVGLHVRYAGDVLRVEVTDGSPDPARLRRAGDDDESGRGLLLVAVLAHEWDTSDGGRTTWCVFRVPTGRP